MHRLVNPVREYEWGSTTYLPDLLGRPPTGRPQAELWIGAHPLDPSMIEGGAPAPRSLLELVDSSPVRQLGQRAAARFSGRLPFLLKVLAVDQPLSLQLHPDQARAARGFRAEDEAGVALAAPERTYKDPYHKPELTWAVTTFETLCGFRRPGESSELLSRLARRAPNGSFFSAAVDDLSTPDEQVAVHRATARALALPSADARACVDLVRRTCAGLGDETGTVAADLAARFPTDPGVLVTLLMNTVRLEPGQALFIRPGTLHTHLRGVAVEIQAGSDNTIRCGLTPKHVAVQELLGGLDCSVGPAELQPALPVSASEVAFRPDVDEFELTVLRSLASATATWERGPAAGDPGPGRRGHPAGGRSSDDARPRRVDVHPGRGRPRRRGGRRHRGRGHHRSEDLTCAGRWLSWRRRAEAPRRRSARRWPGRCPGSSCRRSRGRGAPTRATAAATVH